MATGVVQMLHKSMKEAMKDLTSTDDAIKKLTGRDPEIRITPRRISGPAPGPDGRRTSNGSSGRMRAWSVSHDKTPDPKRTDFEGGRARVSSRLGSGGRDGPGMESNSRMASRLGASWNGPGAKSRETNPQVEPRMRSEVRDGQGTESRDSLISIPRVASRLGSALKDGAGAKSRDPFSSNPRLAGRLGPPPGLMDEGSEGEEEEEEDRPRKRPLLQSSVIAAKVPPRPTAGVDDEGSKNRNRRMFGFLMGTLQKFKETEETSKNTDRERRRQEIEVKVQQTQEIEKAAAIQERKDLFEHRKQQKNKIARLAGQMELFAMHEEWNEHNKKLLGYIKTKTTPHIYYLPVAHNTRTQKLLAQSNQMVEDTIKKRLENLESILAQNEEPQEDNIIAEETSFVGDEQIGAVKVEGGGLREGKVGSESGEASE